MPESKADAKKRAKEKGFKQSQVTKGDDGYYIAPYGVESSAGKKAYASLRSEGKSKEQAAKIAHSVDNKVSDEDMKIIHTALVNASKFR